MKNLTFVLVCHVIGCAEVNDIGSRDGSCRAIQRRLILKTSAVVSQIAEGRSAAPPRAPVAVPTDRLADASEQARRDLENQWFVCAT